MNAFEVLADPTRRRIIELVGSKERSVTELVEALAMNQPAVSKQLSVLRYHGFVAARIDGKRRMYRMLPEPLAEVDAWLAPYRRFWANRLDALQAHMDRNTSRKDTTDGN
jgi:DNA-binding transcriptional ArsR family regulator